MTARLSTANLDQRREGVAVPRYALDSVRRGVVHIGVGHFHRAHQAAYFDDLLCAQAMDWGVTGISLRSARVRDALAPQDFLYTLVEQGEKRSHRVIGALRQIIVARSAPAPAIAALAAPETTVVTTTVTEKGYLPSEGATDFGHDAYRRDLACVDAPKTLFGYLAAALIRRMEIDAGPVTLVCCDNVKGGGMLLEEGTCHLLRHHAPHAVNWARDNASFVSSVVDRVAPGTTDALVRQVRHDTGLADEWPVATEPFRQWVIQDRFAGERPPLDSVGAVYTGDIDTYEQMKLAYLNAGHMIVAVLGRLLGERHVHSALRYGAVARFAKTALINDVYPFVRLPSEVDGLKYIDGLLRRFGNAALPYRVAQVCSDSTEKVQQRWFPSIDRLLKQRHVSRHFPVVLAAWVLCIEQAAKQGALVDPSSENLTGAVAGADSAEALVRGVMRVAGAESFAFWREPVFMNAVSVAVTEIQRNGIRAVIGRKGEAYA